MLGLPLTLRKNQMLFHQCLLVKILFKASFLYLVGTFLPHFLDAYM